MVGEPSSPREARLAALRILAETVISKTDDEKGHWDWTGRSEVLEVIALLASVNRSKLGEQISEVAPTSSRPEGDTSGVEISPTIPWMVRSLEHDWAIFMLGEHVSAGVHETSGIHRHNVITDTLSQFATKDPVIR